MSVTYGSMSNGGPAYYHFTCSHQSLRVPVRGPSRFRYRTPAMAVGITRQRWSVVDILTLPMPAEVWLQTPTTWAFFKLHR